jgi:cytochrome c553
MRSVLKWSAIAVGGLAGIALAAMAYVYVASERIIDRHYPLPQTHIASAMGADAIAHGAHLAKAYGCSNCHGADLRGRYIEDFGMSSRNLPELAMTFTDDDFDRVIHAGLRPDGTSVSEEMPSDAFRYMPQRDMAFIAAYIRSLPAGGNAPPEPSYGWKKRYALLFGTGRTDVMWFAIQRPALDLGPKYAYGRQLAMTACGECHTTMLEGHGSDTPDLSLVASYGRGDFFRFMRTGLAAGNRELPLMSATARARFSHFSDDELGAIYDYLATRGQKLTASGGG